MKELHVHQQFHLGDSIYNIHIYRRWLDIHTDLRIFYYIQPHYWEPLKDFIKGYEDRLIFGDYNQRPHYSICNWLGDWTGFKDGHYYGQCYTQIANGVPFDVLYLDFYRHISNKNGLECPFNNNIESLVWYDEFLDDVNIFGNHIDFLITNSSPMSNQWNFYDEFEFIYSKLDLDKYNVISLQPTGNPNIPCTMDAGLNLLQLGNLAMKSDNILGVHSSPWSTLVNKHSINSVKKWACFQEHGIYYSWNCINYKSPELVKNEFEKEFLG